MLRIIRTLKIDILTLFLTLNIISILFIISMTYVENYKAITSFTKTATARVGIALDKRMAEMSDTAIDILENTSVLFTHSIPISIGNQQLIQYMLNTLSYNNDLSSFILADTAGNSIIVEDIQLTGQTHYYNDASRPLPTASRYLVRVIDLARKPTPEVWIYKDNRFNTLSSENLPTLSIKTSERPWYINALQSKTTAWSDFFPLTSTHLPGIAVSKPIYNEQGKLLGVTAADLSNLGFTSFISFLQQRDQHKPGKIYITDHTGKILSASEQIVAKSHITQSMVYRAFQRYQKTHENTATLKGPSGSYIFFINHTPANFGKDFFVIIALPFNNVFEKLLHAQLLTLAMALAILIVSTFIIIAFAKRLSKPISALAVEINKIKKLDFSSTHRVRSYIKEIKLIDNSVAAMRHALHSFTRYVPKEIVKQLLSKGKEITLAGEKKEVTILFSDVEGFTTIAEKIKVETLMSILTDYFDGLSKIILSSQGTIDKYIGDGIMAFWGAPKEVPNHCTVACLTALRCQAFLRQFNHQQNKSEKPQFNTRFGINTGTVIVGNVGTMERMNYTMIGDAVNVASRLESLDKVYHIGIMISETVYKKTGEQFLVRPLDKLAVQGTQNEIKIYELVASLHTDAQTDATPAQIELCTAFCAAYQAFEAKQYRHAKQLFVAIQDKFPDDFPTQMYLQRINQCEG